MDIYKSKQNLFSKIGKKRIDLLFLSIFIVSFVLSVVAIFFDKNIRLLSFDIQRIYGQVMSTIIVICAISFLVSFLFAKIKAIKIFFGILIGIIGTISILSLIGFRSYHVKGISMTPNILDGQYAIVYYFAYGYNPPKRGDVIIFYTPITQNQEISVSRVIGLPGENISIRNNKIYINDVVLKEPYISTTVETSPGNRISDKNILIPENEYAVFGDNRLNSWDSRYFGFIKSNSIRGRVLFSRPTKTSVSLVQQTSSENSLSKTEASLSPFQSCRTLETKMISDSTGKGEIGCDVEVNGQFDLSRSYCEGQKSHITNYLMPDAYQRPNRYYATLKGLDFKEEVKVFIYSGSKIECLPSLNK